MKVLLIVIFMASYCGKQPPKAQAFQNIMTGAQYEQWTKKTRN